MWRKEDAYRLSQMRNKRHISARKMSSDLGLSENYINKIESASSKPSLDKFIEICKYLDVSLDEIVGYKTVSTPKLNETINGLKNLSETDLEHIAVMIKRLQQE